MLQHWHPEAFHFLKAIEHEKRSQRTCRYTISFGDFTSCILTDEKFNFLTLAFISKGFVPHFILCLVFVICFMFDFGLSFLGLFICFVGFVCLWVFFFLGVVVFLLCKNYYKNFFFFTLFLLRHWKPRAYFSQFLWFELSLPYRKRLPQLMSSRLHIEMRHYTAISRTALKISERLRLSGLPLGCEKSVPWRSNLSYINSIWTRGSLTSSRSKLQASPYNPGLPGLIVS